jgi:hypothetical protein
VKVERQGEVSQEAGEDTGIDRLCVIDPDGNPIPD